MSMLNIELQRAVVAEDPRVHYWGEFFVRAGLYPFLRFDEFMRDPEAFVRAITEPGAPMPKAMPTLNARIRAHLRWHGSGALRRVLVAGETR